MLKMALDANGALQPGKQEPQTIDLTADDDDDEPVFVSTRISTAPLHDENEHVCLGIIYPAVLCMYGLPPELQLHEPPGAVAFGSFWKDPAYCPVHIYAEDRSNVAPTVSAPFALANAQRTGLLVSTLGQALDGKYRMVNQYGTLADKFSCVLGRLMQTHSVLCISRGRRLPPRAAAGFTQGIETLLFASRRTAGTVAAALAVSDIPLYFPETYTPAEFPGSPPLMEEEEVMMYTHEPRRTVQDTSPQVQAGIFAAGGAERDLLFRPSSYTYNAPSSVSSEDIEAEQQAQIDAVYANLRGGEDLPETEAGPLLKTSMYSHQKQALTFLLDRERERSFNELLADDEERSASVSLWQAAETKGSKILRFRNIVTQTVTSKKPHICRGAILADDMGLGKTITTIAMIAKTLGEAISFGNSPLKNSDDDELTILGDTRNRRTAEQARKEELRCRSRATLLVCPLSIITNWESQIRQHWHEKAQPSIYIYHGQSRLRDPYALADYDVVITTYSTLGYEFSNQTTWTAAAGRDDREIDLPRKGDKPDAPNTCQRIEWFRIVLDEAHLIKESRTWQSKAVCNLSAVRRLCLTGTPVQNRIDDIYGLILFLRLDPFTDRTVWNHFCGDRRHVHLNQPRGKGDELLDSTRLARVQTIMKFLTLRRVKSDRRADGAPILQLPPKMARLVHLKWDPTERAKYEKLHSRFREEFAVHVERGTVGVNYATILHEILILRMMCDHAELVEDSQDSHLSSNPSNISEAIRTGGLTRRRAAEFFSMVSMFSATCNACTRELFLEEAYNSAPVVTRCQHLFCTRCMPITDRTTSCPSCGTVLLLATDAVLLHPEDSARAEHTEKSGSDRDPWSTKIRALVDDLLPFSLCNPHSRNYNTRAPVLDHVIPEGGSTDSENGTAQIEVRIVDSAAPIKSVVFSQWTRMLDKIGRALDKSKISYVQLDGSMNRTQREASLSRFEKDLGTEVLLISLRAGGFGLNLVSACRAYLVDPYWNPAVENQGLDRVHRLGQNRPVITTKFVMEQSIEEKMLALQRHKTELANRVGSRRPMDTKQHRTEELKLLFS